MNWKKIARNLNEYYLSVRAVGHTKAMLDGVRNTPHAMALFATYRQGEHYKLSTAQIVTLNTLDNGDRLQGMSKPLALDHNAVFLILNGLLDNIEGLEDEIERLKEKLKK